MTYSHSNTRHIITHSLPNQHTPTPVKNFFVLILWAYAHPIFEVCFNKCSLWGEITESLQMWFDSQYAQWVPRRKHFQTEILAFFILSVTPKSTAVIWLNKWPSVLSHYVLFPTVWRTFLAQTCLFSMCQNYEGLMRAPGIRLNGAQCSAVRTV